MGSGGRHVFMMCWEFGVFGCAWVVRGKLLYSYLVLLLIIIIDYHTLERPHHGVKAGERQTREARYNTTIVFMIQHDIYVLLF